MLFNTPDFVIFFIIFLTTIVVVKNRKFQHLFLLLASYFFFYYSSNYLIILLLYTTIWDFYLGQAIHSAQTPAKKRALLVMSLAGNLGLLGFFKYADFAIMQFNVLGQQFNLAQQVPLLNLALPIAISFYTFHSIGYIIDIYRGSIKPTKSFTDYAIFVAFFPQLVAGPILRAGHFLPQLREKIEEVNISARLRQIVIENTNLKLGITMMAFGLFKKMFFADNISSMVNDIFENPMGLDSFTIILGAIGFGIQIYCDFSGYSDIALGAALIMGFKIPINFNKPYFATSPSDFWRRWHISLSSWLRDYLYIPLGGNRKSHLRTYFNLMTVMFLGGLWHGASWNFVIWGVLHGAYLAVHKAISDKFPGISANRFFKSKAGFVFSILATQYLVFLTWIAFRVQNADYMLYAMQKYVFVDFQTADTMKFLLSHKFPFVIMILFIILHIISYRKGNLVERISNWSAIRWTIFLIVAMMGILFFYDGNPEDFIYFKF
jgi:alginate O-acetyltransferase complex protein AlgI